MFSKAPIQELFKNYIVVQLYTDVVPDEFYAPDLRSAFQGTSRQDKDAKVNFNFQGRHFELQLPLYLVLEPQLDEKVNVVGIYPEGTINNEPGFIEFLKNPS